MYQNTKTYHFRCRYKSLKEDFETWRPHYKEIQELVAPRKGRYLLNDTEKVNDGVKKHNKIINSKGIKAVRTIAAGLQGGLTSPSRPWFVLGLDDKELMDYAPVRDWLHAVRQRVLSVFSRSNFYGAVYHLYQELASFGTNALLIEEDVDTVIRARPFTVGEYYLGLDEKYKPDTLYRLISFTAKQLVEKFGIDKVSDNVKTAYESSTSMEKRFDVLHCIEKYEANKMQDLRYEGNFLERPYISVYFELAGNPDKLLEVGSFRTLPFVAPRWDVNGVDTYGMSPGMDALGDIKMLQKMEEKKLKGLDKMIDPPMNAPVEMRGKGGSLVSGDINFYSQQAGIPGFVPVHEVRLDFNNLAFELERVEKRIESDFYNDLFLAVINADKSNMTALEISKRYEEKLLMLGPVLERLQSEFLDPIILRTISIMEGFGLLPPMPKELQGRELKFEYISMLAQAQKMVGITAIEQMSAYIGNIAAVKPEALDKLNVDEAIDVYADLVGVPPSIILTNDQANDIRKVRSLQMAKQQQLQNELDIAAGAKNLSAANVGENNALEALLGVPK